MRCLTVRQPWAAAIAHHGKTVENRVWTTTYRGPLAIHAGRAFDRTALPRVAELSGIPAARVEAVAERGAIVAVAELVDVDYCNGSCSPWAFTGCFHWHLADVRPLPAPVPARGRLGLWTLDPPLLAACSTPGPVSPASAMGDAR